MATNFCLLRHGGWPCSHADEHARAARLGWARRKGALPSADVLSFSFLFGAIRKAHEDPSHPNEVRFQDKKGDWYGVAKKDWAFMVGEGRKAQRAAGRSAAKEERDRVRWEAQQERDLRKENREQRAKVIRSLKHSKIRPYRMNLKGKIPELEEWRELPTEIRSRSGRLTMDEAADMIGREFPDTGIQTDSDLINYLRRSYSRAKVRG